MNNSKDRVPIAAEIVPELSLVYAVLERAILDAAGDSNIISDNDRKNALAWILKKIEVAEPWDFEWICEHLNIDADRSRKNIIRYLSDKEKEPRGRTAWATVARKIIDEDEGLLDLDYYYHVDPEFRILSNKKQGKSNI